MITTENTNEFLEPVDRKLRWAEKHADALVRSIRAWSDSNPVRPRSELRDGRLGFRLVLDDFSEPDAIDSWGLMLGDWAHSLRSSLDVLAYALARIHRDPPSRPDQVKFPVCERREDFVRIRRRALGEVHPSAANLIELVQPFQRTGNPGEGTPDLDPLLALQELNNHDKHRVPVVARVSQRELAHRFAVKFASSDGAAANVPPDVTLRVGPLGPGVVLLERRTTPPIVEAAGGVECRCVVTAHVRSVDVDVIPLVADRTRYVRELVARFRPFFVPAAGGRDLCPEIFRRSC